MSTNPFVSPVLGEHHDAVTEPMPPRARIVLKLMQKMTRGSLTVTLPLGHVMRFGQGNPHAEIVLNNWNVCDASFKNGDIGFGETYIAGDWTTPNLSALLDVMVGNRNEFEAVVYGTWWGKLLYRAKHLLNRNTRGGSKKNIHAHYDIGNDFYKLWLDEGMTYSSAVFDGLQGDDVAVLGEAQRTKYRRIFEKLELPEQGGKVLEIGCGWGAFAELGAKAGHHVTGLTLSPAQLDFAHQRLAAKGLADRTDLRLQDYRDSRGQYDGIASIEMFEAVGEAYWPSYFECIKRSLKPGARAVIQTITIDDALFDAYRKSSDFIQQYIFPGGMLPSPSVFKAQAERAGLVVVESFAFGQDYARTLHAWLRSFESKERSVRELGFDTAFMRTWAFYLAYCEAAFRHANTNVIQFTLAHASKRRAFSLALGAALAGATAVSVPEIALADDELDLPSEAPSQVVDAIGPAHLYGAGVFRYFGFHVYDAYLWVGALGLNVDQPYLLPFALDICYARRFKGSAINQTTIDEWDRLEIGTEEQRHVWFERLAPLMPDVVPGQHLTGVFLPNEGWRLYSDGKQIGAIADVDFAKAFFAIWLDPRTKARKLRQHLLSLPDE